MARRGQTPIAHLRHSGEHRRCIGVGERIDELFHRTPTGRRAVIAPASAGRPATLGRGACTRCWHRVKVSSATGSSDDAGQRASAQVYPNRHTQRLPEPPNAAAIRRKVRVMPSGAAPSEHSYRHPIDEHPAATTQTGAF